MPMAAKKRPERKIRPVFSKERLKALREAAGLTQQELAVKAGTNAGVIAGLEQQGGTPDPRLSTVAALAKALGVSVEDLMSEQQGEAT